MLTSEAAIRMGPVALPSAPSAQVERRELPPVEPATPARAPTEEPERPREAAEASELTPAEKKIVEALRQRDREVRSHELAHKTVGGSWAGPINFTYRVGPDQRRYVVDGEVAIDLSPVANNPEATARKMEQVRRAALAPASPSNADRQVAAQAAALEKAATAEVRAARQASLEGEDAEGTVDLRRGPVAHVTRALLAPHAVAAYAKWAAEARYEAQASPTILSQL